jgi:ADP-heptose:LPS heptosyltransferase
VEHDLLRARREGAGRPHGGVSYRPSFPRARHAIAACVNPLDAPPPADRILVIRLGAVGDVVRTLPAVSSLRAAYAGAQLAWLVEPPAASLLRGQPWIDETIVFPRDRLEAALRARAPGALLRELAGFLRTLRRRRFDLVVDFHGILRSALLAFASGARRRVSYARPFGREGAWLLATHRAELPPARISRFERNAALVDYLAVSAREAATPLRVDRARLAKLSAELGAPVVIHPGTSDATPYKRYTVEGYAEVARELARRDGLRCVVSAGPACADRVLAEQVVAASQGAARLAPATPTLADLALLFAASRLYIGSDTGPMHVASLVGTPVVQLLGPTDPVENAPWHATASRQLRVPVPCSPCRRGCDSPICMRGIRVQQVLGAARELLALEAAPLSVAGGRA